MVILAGITTAAALTGVRFFDLILDLYWCPGWFSVAILVLINHKLSSLSIIVISVISDSIDKNVTIKKK